MMEDAPSSRMGLMSGVVLTDFERETIEVGCEVAGLFILQL